MFERFTAAARGVVVAAQQEARELGHPIIGTEHVLIALVADEDTPVARLLRGYRLDAPTVRDEIRRHVGTYQPDLSFTEVDAEDAAALKAIGIDLAAVRAAIEESFGAGSLRLPKKAPRKRGLFGRFYATTGGHIPFSPRAKKVLELSLREALRLGHNYIAPEHLMLGLLREGAGLAAQILAERQVDFDLLRAGLARSLDEKAA
jgi:ATP-dependent Clp protease ATP-binding subunit ClpA